MTTSETEVDCYHQELNVRVASHTPWNINPLQILISLKPLTLLKLIFRAIEIRQIATFDTFPEVLFLTFHPSINLALTAAEIA